ncbi:MAG: HAD-IA family hydrolase [Alphaproteobacteria bacterium]|nr:HAD-IA family hydrolase [Alphaproteobacteria bacterium]
MTRALLLDAGGTLLSPAEPVAQTYARLGKGFAVPGAAAIAPRLRAAFAAGAAWRQIGDGRPFWRTVVATATGCDDPDYFERLYAWYVRPDAWRLAPGAREAVGALRARGVGVAVVSNWDTRLRPLLEGMGVAAWIDALVCSGELGLEKPDPAIFLVACAALGVAPADALHVGDSAQADVAAARAAGCQAALWDHDLTHMGALGAWFTG